LALPASHFWVSLPIENLKTRFFSRNKLTVLTRSYTGQVKLFIIVVFLENNDDLFIKVGAAKRKKLLLTHYFLGQAKVSASYLQLSPWI
jgi:hypothetical protein